MVEFELASPVLEVCWMASWGDESWSTPRILKELGKDLQGCRLNIGISLVLIGLSRIGSSNLFHGLFCISVKPIHSLIHYSQQ